IEYMLKIIFEPNDLLNTCSALIAKKKFTPGFDNMTLAAAATWIEINGEKLSHQLNASKYESMPALGFYVAKTDGHYRELARLTAIDTIIQNAVIQKLSNVCEEKFSNHSFAYRKGRGTGTALNKYCEYATQYHYAAKIDPKSCFNNIDFDILEAALQKFFFTRKSVALLMNFARMPIITEGKLTERSKGILQGAPISGMLCNIYLHELDLKLEEMSVPFIRYADDVVVFSNSSEEINKLYSFVCSYFAEKLHLEINRSKCCISPSEKLSYLGHKFLRDKNDVVSIRAGDDDITAYYDWYSYHPANHRNSVDILSDGILRQKDFSAVFESETNKSFIPTSVTERINIFSSVILDSKFLECAMKAGIYINVFGKDYSFIGRFVPSAPLKDQRLIFEQLCAYNNESERLKIAKEFDLASTHNLRLNIRYYNKQNPDPVYSKTLDVINKLYKRMKDCTDYDELLLIEAKIREAYYGCYDSFIKNKQFVFRSRSRKPPINEVNSLLSFGNVVLYNYIATEIYKSSLDIRIGYLHATNKREESLNLDVAEIFKPLIVDRVVFTLINRREITPASFEIAENGGVYLNEDGKKIFLRAFYDKMNSTQMIKGSYYSYSMLISEEIRKLTRRFRADEPYRAFRQVR
ncbi:MAG: CRISPR-associated endonuclease Cas1, partial [Acutalibacteraceae bacterium]